MKLNVGMNNPHSNKPLNISSQRTIRPLERFGHANLIAYTLTIVMEYEVEPSSYTKVVASKKLDKQLQA